MKIVTSSDWHLDYFTDGYDRHDDVNEAIACVVGELEMSNDDDDNVFLFLGDLSNPNSRTVHRAIAASVAIASDIASDMSATQYWMTGNHDVQENGLGSHTLMAIDAAEFPRCEVVAGPRIIKEDGVYLVLLPYTPLCSSYDPAEFIKRSRDDIPDKATVIIAGHLSIEGITPGGETMDMSRGRDVYFPLETCNHLFPKATLLNGHYHEAQTFRGIHIPGSLVRLTHGEEDNNPGYLVLDT